MELALAIQNSADRTTTPPRHQLRPIGGRLKRSFDVCAAIIALVLLLPLILSISAIIFSLNGGPVIIRHRRIGHAGESFGCLKFRTMVKNAEDVLARHLREDPKAAEEWEKQRKLCKDPRVTKIGSILRKTSLDELPQLLNILNGDMSLVGPRPIVEDEIPKYGSAVRLYLQARPGLTGAWQVNGRSDIEYQKRVALDSDYLTNWSLKTDVIIILRTLPAVIKARGVY